MKKILTEQILTDKLKEFQRHISKGVIMGYRSDVAYTIRFKTEEDYHLFVLEAKANPEIAGALDECECNDRRFRIDFRAEDTKWYDSYPDVAMHEKLIDQAQEWVDECTHREIKDGGSGHDAYRLGYVFVRIGEDDNDVVRLEGGNNGYDWLSVRREIVEG
jgi:hypothetical protein